MGFNAHDQLKIAPSEEALFNKFGIKLASLRRR